MGDQAAAAQARAQAIQAYFEYRRDGGENQNPGARLCQLVFEAIGQGQTQTAEQYLVEQFSGPDAGDWDKALVPKLQARLDGNRDPALAADPALDYDDAAELQLLLERLGSSES